MNWPRFMMFSGASSNRRGGPYRIWRRGLAATAPTWFLLVLAELFLWVAGETTPVKKVAVAHLDADAPAAYLPALMNQEFSRFHIMRINRFRPDVLVLGSLRVMRFRQEMFAPDTSFYNSSRLVTSVAHLEKFVEAMPQDYAPKTLLWGIDSWWLSNDWAIDPDVFKGQGDETKLLTSHVLAYRRLFSAVLQGKIDLELIERMVMHDDGGIKRYGLIAWTAGGFHNDGSYRDLDMKRKSSSLARPMTMRPDRKIFADGPAVNPVLLQRLMAALKVLADRGSTIIAFAPPYTAGIRQEFAEDPVQASYFADFQRTTAESFRTNGWYFYDGSDPKDFGLDDRCMEDGHHPMETYLVALLATMSQDAEVRAALRLDPGKLRAILGDAGTTAWYPAYPPTRRRARTTKSRPAATRARWNCIGA